MSQHDPPLWSRAVAALLLPFAGWWLWSTPAARATVGDSVAPVAVTLVAGFLLLGMRSRLGLWPQGPWRDRFSRGVVVAVAVAFALAIVVFDPLDSPDVAARLDPGVYALTALGVVAWGFAWSFVRQEAYLPWFALAAGAALVPLVVGGVGVVMLEGGSPSVCFVTARGTAPCVATGLQVFGFMAAVGTAGALITHELAFRRLLLGHPDRVGLALVLLAAAAAAAWARVYGTGTVSLTPEWWLVGLAAVSAGALYVLSGSILVSSVFTGLAFAGRDALYASRAAAVAGPLERLPTVFLAAHLLVAGGLAVWVWRRKGFLQGLR